MTSPLENEIRAMVDRETAAWNAQDAAALADLIHPDMVWPWPRGVHAHDPVDWVMPMGRFERTRWIGVWQSLFDSATVVHNDRRLVKVLLSNEEDGALAVVDIDTLWKQHDGSEDNWKGRVGKVYTKLPSGEWKLIMHTGVLDYASLPPQS